MNEYVWEYEESPGLVSVKGRLADHVTFWEEAMKAPEYIVNIIWHGYVIPFLKVPTAFCQPNQSSTCNDHDFVDKAFDDLLRDGCVKEVEQQPHISASGLSCSGLSCGALLFSFMVLSHSSSSHRCGKLLIFP